MIMWVIAKINIFNDVIEKCKEFLPCNKQQLELWADTVIINSAKSIDLCLQMTGERENFVLIIAM